MEVAHLRARFDAEYAAYAGSRGDRRRMAHAWRLYEICCAYEQIYADLYFDVSHRQRAWCAGSARAFAQLASQLAGPLSRGECADELDAAVVRCRAHVIEQDSGPLAAAPHPPDVYVRLPECFTRDLLDLAAYARFVRERLEELAPTAVAVVGIRTTGSYLAPVWEAVLRAREVPRITVTARPKRDPRIAANGRFTDASPTDCWLPPDEDARRLVTWFAARDPRTVSVVVIDDLAFTGSQFVRVDNYFRGIGVRATNIVFVQNTPLVMTSLTPTGFERLSTRRVWSAPKVPDGPRRPDAAGRFFADLLSGDELFGCEVEVVSARLAPPTFAQRHLAAATTVPVEQFVHFNPRGRDRHYIVDARMGGRPTRLFAKVLGTGLFADEEVRRIRQFAGSGYRVTAHRGGFLLYEWIDGRPLRPDEGHRLTDDDIDQLSEYAAALSRLNPAGNIRPDRYADDVVSRLRAAVDLPAALSARVAEEATAFVGACRDNLPMVDAPRNHGHWHHLRASDGRLRRVHLDLGEWSWRMDIAEELAATAIELGLSRSQTARLVAGYRARTGAVDVASRMTMATVSYVARTFDLYRFWASQLEQIPARFRRRSDDPALNRARSRQTRLLRALEVAVIAGEEEISGA